MELVPIVVPTFTTIHLVDGGLDVRWLYSDGLLTAISSRLVAMPSCFDEHHLDLVPTFDAAIQLP